MPLKLKVTPRPGQEESVPPTPSAPTPSTGGPPKLKLSVSQPPTPATETPPSATAKKKTAKQSGGTKGKKRAAEDDISPAPKKPAPARKPSLKPPQQMVRPEDEITTPISAGGLNKLKLKRKQSVGPKLTGLFASKGRPPPKRQPGSGYDSEDSDVEEDPAIQQGVVLRMQPGEDADYLRDAIANGKIGLSKDEGGADASVRFLTHDFRRAAVKVRSHVYAAVLVDLPCIVESMKSWDKKGWWKVSDICQMLLVLGRCKDDEEAKNFPLPREVDQKTMRYAHGLTPPMHWVRKRRFRKRVDHRTIVNIDDEVDRLIEEDKRVEDAGGRTEILDRDPAEREASDQEDAEGEIDGEGAYETVEGQEYEEYYDDQVEEEDAANLEDDLAAAFAADDLTNDHPVPMADQAASFAAVENEMARIDTEPPTPIAQPPETPAESPPETQEQTQDEQSSDEDESDEDGDSPDAYDEDAAARAAEKAQQLEEVADIEREVANVRARAAAMTNQLLKNRELNKLASLERELAVKRETFGLNVED